MPAAPIANTANPVPPAAALPTGALRRFLRSCDSIRSVRLFAVALAGATVSCSGGGDRSASPPPPPPPPIVSLAAPDDPAVLESDNPQVPVTVRLDRAAPGPVGVGLQYSGTATRDHDYAAGSDSVQVPAGATSASALLDIYRDFDEEGDETIAVALGTLTGDARMGEDNSFTLTVMDGETPVEPPAAEIADPETALIPFGFAVTGESVKLAVGALNFSPDGEAVDLVAEWSTDFGFLAGVHEFGRAAVAAAGPDPFDAIFSEPHEFVLPFSRLAPNGHYFIRAYLGAPPQPDSDPSAFDVFFEGFATDAEGRVATRCEIPSRTPGASGADPLFAQQWHLVNTGQTAFSDRGGVAGEDLRMTASIAAGHGGSGVTLAILDTGLEICHPDLAANAGAGGSYNFAHESLFGASPSDPYNPSTLGDHGTSVAGVAAAVAGNGLGGRGVAAEATLVGFNIGVAAEQDPELALLRSLGASENAPDSAAVDVFNMSFGTEEPSANASEDMTRLLEMGASELRGGRGAIYVKAAGNEFSLCDGLHPLSREIGCISSHADPMQNLPYVIAVGAFNADGVKSSYSSAGANLWVVAPGGEDGIESPAIVTTDQAGTQAGFGLYGGVGLTDSDPLNRDGDYMGDFGGTSSASPLAAGAAAMLLGVNPDLTWRDVKHILAATARRIDPDRPRVRAAFNGNPYIALHAWQSNAAGYPFHNWYGFGAVDLDAAVSRAMTHAPDSLGEFVESEWFGPHEEISLPVPAADGAGVSATMEVTGLPDGANLEAVILEITVEHRNALGLGVTLLSPAGTPSVLNPPFNGLLDGYPGLHEWRLMSNAFYGEQPNGAWTVQVVDLAGGDAGMLTAWRLRFYYGDHP